MRGTVRKRGKGWQALLTVHDSARDKSRQLSSTHPTKAEAEHWLVRAAAQYGLGEGAAHSMTIRELLNTWYDQKAPDWSPSNRRNNRNAIDKVLVPRFGDTLVLKLKAADLDQWYTSLRRSLNPATIRKYHNVIHAAYKMAERYDWVMTNPATKASPPRISRKPIDVPSLDELLALTHACEELDPRLGFAVHLAAVTGARRGELLALRWSDFDERRRVMRIWNAVILGEGDKPTLKHGTKTGKERTIALDEWTFERMREHRAWCEARAKEAKARLRDTSFLFSNDIDCHAPMSPDYLSSMYQKARRSAGLNNLRLHDLRHYHITQLLVQGVDVATVAGRVGHAGGGRMTLEVYSHWVPEADREAAEIAVRQFRQAG
jgi:integrase